ncbi:MAG TPA: hypothetical protein VEJ41_06505 [Candidatus Acidoferrales bacterium]|nr:hypothetical protein [Candidatus Acidoferrales bacterium]
MVNRQIDGMGELQSAFSLLFKNWILAIPPAIVALAAGIYFAVIVAGMVGGILAAGAMGTTPNFGALFGGGGLLILLGVLVILLLSVLALAIVIGAAERVWHGQPADLAGGISKALSKLPSLILLFIIFGIIGIIPFIGWLVDLVLAFFWFYAMPGIVLGNLGTTQAMSASWKLASANAGPTITALLGIIVVNIIGGIINVVCVHIPILGLIVSFVVGGLTSAYAALVIVRFYDLVAGSSASAPPSSTT